MAKSAAAKVIKANRRELCEQLLTLRLKHADIFSEIERLKASVVELATEEGDNFREVFTDQGVVSVSGARPKEFRGHVSEVDPKIFDALSETKRQKLIDDGIVKVVPHWSRDFHGRVDIKIF